jgi:biotin carboxyl carrier protein
MEENQQRQSFRGPSSQDSSERDPSERAEQPFAKRIGRILIWFFVAMLALTFLSRAASDALKAKVSVGYISSGALDLSVSGTGKWVSGETQFFTTYFARRISKVFIKPGQAVAEGDPLFAYDVSTVTGGKTVSEQKLVAAQRALEKAKAELEKQPDSTYAASTVDNAQQALLFAEFTHEQYVALQNGGVVRATCAGTIVSCDLVAGKTSVAGTSGLELALGTPQLELRVPKKEAERFAIGDEIVLMREGKQEDETLRVRSISAPDTDEMVTMLGAKSAEGTDKTERKIGGVQDWKIRKKSGQYYTCVPLEALRQGGGDTYYVYVIREVATILGTELEAQKVDVDLLAHDDKRAAVDAELTSEDRLITACSKEIADGDRVVLHDGD